MTDNKMRKNLQGDSKSSLAMLISVYRHSAKKRGYCFELTREQFAELTKQNCWYCGVKPSQIKHEDRRKSLHRGFYLYNGIDRMDNNQGYTEANCIPCCSRCNKMKGILSGEDFIGQVRRIGFNLNLF